MSVVPSRYFEMKASSRRYEVAVAAEVRTGWRVRLLCAFSFVLGGIYLRWAMEYSDYRAVILLSVACVMTCAPAGLAYAAYRVTQSVRDWGEALEAEERLYQEYTKRA